jgi:5-formyltetrahydrofolate cyclo-ligase
LADTPPEPGPGAGKEEWREWSRRVRATLDLVADSEAVVDALVAWEPLREARTVLLYLPLPDEVDVTGLQERVAELTYVATRTPAHGGTLSIHQLTGPLEGHPYGFLQPSAAAPTVAPSTVDVWLLPGLAFDRHGTRLGRGGGYFDELTGRAPGSTLVGVGPAACVVDQLPHEPHDRPVQFLVTEDGMITIGD